MPSKIRDIADILGVTEAANPTNAVLTSVADGSGLVVYATLDDLPTSGLTAGDQAYITATNRLYVSNGSGWYNVALINATPTLSISPSGAVTLAVDGSTPTVITLTGTDSDNADTNLTYSVESDGSFAGLGTISQDSSVFTITPLAEGSATPGSSTLTFKVSDGISFGSGTTEFSLTFGPDWSSSTSTQILPSTSLASAQFGRAGALSSDGNYLIISSGGENSGYGAAYVYVKSGSNWTQQARLTPSQNGKYGFGAFDISLSSDGTYAIIGSGSEEANSFNNQGAVYIFTRSGSTWTQQQRIQIPVPKAFNVAARFGDNAVIDSSATYLLIGEINHDLPVPPAPYNPNNAGIVYFYTRSGSTWTQQGEVPSSDLSEDDNYGSSISMSSDGTYAIVGAPKAAGNSNQTGAAYIFTRSGSTWTQQAKLSASDGAYNDYFGAGVSMSSDGSYSLVSALNADGNEATDGAVYVFTRSGSTWTQQAKLIGSDTVDTDYFGGINFSHRVIDINSDGTIVAISAYQKSVSGYLGVGRIYIFERDGSTWSQTNILDKSGTVDKDYYSFGFFVKLTNDGSTVLTGATSENPGGVNFAGAGYIIEAG